MIGFVNLGDVNNHLLAFEQSANSNTEDSEEGEVLAKTMMAMMVRGLFSTLRFPYAHFPCEKVTGELLFHPFWEAIYRLERMGLKVRSIKNSPSDLIIIKLGVRSDFRWGICEQAAGKNT
jgi:hypothetical protein